MFGFVTKTVPNFFRGYAQASFNRLGRDFRDGKASPYFKFITLVGVVGYAMQYSVVWSKQILFIFLRNLSVFSFLEYRIAEKQDVVKVALKDLHHH